MRTYRTPSGNTEPRPFQINDVTFECIPVVTGDQLREVFLALCGDDNGTIKWEEHLRGFFTEVMTPEEVTRFEAFVNDQDNIVHLTLLYGIAKDLYEDYSGRPFGEVFSSLASRLTDGASSTDEPLSTEPVSTT